MNPHGQRGVALLVALLVVALATLLIAGLLDRGELTAARTRNLLRAEQADAYARGMEAYAARVLLLDLEQDANVDTHGDIWAMPMPPTPVPGGQIGAQMRDLNGCFNLNNLVGASGAVDALWRQQFERLLEVLELDRSFAAIVVDWIDRDGDTGERGAEDNAYLNAPLPYRAANRAFAHVSELRLLKGMTDAVYARLAPNVCALPRGSTINVNTAGVAVLMTLSSAATLTRPLAERLWSEGHAHYNNIEELRADLLKQGVVADFLPHFGVQSDYFLARGDITLDQLPFAFFSVIHRGIGGSAGGIRVIARSRGGDL